MTKQDPEEFYTCGCRARRHHATCPIHDPAIDEPEEIETLPPIPDSMIPEWVDRVDEFDSGELIILDSEYGWNESSEPNDL